MLLTLQHPRSINFNDFISFLFLLKSNLTVLNEASRFQNRSNKGLWKNNSKNVKLSICSHQIPDDGGGGDQDGP